MGLAQLERVEFCSGKAEITKACHRRHMRAKCYDRAYNETDHNSLSVCQVMTGGNDCHCANVALLIAAVQFTGGRLPHR